MKRAAAGKRGRPRSFDRDVALDRAMLVFWRRGYEATTVGDLVAALGVSPPSLYAAFGDKERLFLEAVARYGAGPGAASARILDEEPTARGAVARLLAEAAAEMTRPGHPPGCLVVNAAVNCTAASRRVEAALARLRAASGDRLRRRLERGAREGDLRAGADLPVLARFYLTVLHGMSLRARDGATRGELAATGRAAMRAWPAS